MNTSNLPFLKEPERLSQCKRFFFDEYNYYFNEREKIKKEIIFALNKSAVPYSFEDWFRLVSTKYSANPLDARGSMENATGGRFNIGNIKKDLFPAFPALYTANGKDTCVKEVYGGMEMFFSDKRGNSFFRVNGCINTLLDITRKGSLNKFMKVIKKITLSRELKKRANQLELNRSSLQRMAQLKKDLYDKNWKLAPNIYDIPSVSQIFGQLAKSSGIEGILYQSTRHSKTGLCLAVFPENFKNSESYIDLKDCPKNIKYKRLDLESYQKFY